MRLETLLVFFWRTWTMMNLKLLLSAAVLGLFLCTDVYVLVAYSWCAKMTGVSIKCQACDLCSYYQSVRCFFLLLVLLRRCRGCRLSWLCWCIRVSGRRACGRCIHKDFIRHSEANLLSLVHVQVVRPLVRLILPNPNLFCFITAALAKDGFVAVKLKNDSTVMTLGFRPARLL